MNQTRRILCVVALLAGLGACSRSPAKSFEQGVAYFKAEKFSKAAGCFEQAVQTGTPTAQAWNFLGVCRLNTGKTEEAITAFQEALKLDDSHVAARYNLAVAMLEANQHDQAIPYLRQLAQNRQCPPSVHYQLGRAYLQAGAWAQAKQALNKFNDADANADIQNSLGVVEARLGNAKQAKLHFESALRLDPNLATGYLNLAVLEQHYLSQKQAAAQHYQKFLDLSPKAQQREDIRLAIAQLTQEPSQRPKAVEVVTPPPAPKPVTPPKPVEPAPQEPPPVVKAEPAPVPVPVAAPVATPVVAAPAAPPKPVVKRRSPVSPPSVTAGNRTKAKAYFNEGIALQQQTKLSAAISSYSKAIAADPTYAQAYYNLAIAYRDARQPEKALDNYELALAINPDFSDARFNYAILLQQEDYIPDALAQYEKILEKNPTEASIHLTVATLYARDRNAKDKARQHYQAYLKYSPNSPLSRDIRDWLSKNP